MRNAISAELLKACGHVLAEHVASVLSKVWEQEKTPADWEIATITPLFKKRSRFECSNC